MNLPSKNSLLLPAISGIAGTSLMTLYSYLLSGVKGENFKEPELLGILGRRAFPNLSKRDSQVAGWIAHYIVGIIFCMIYRKLWQSKRASNFNYNLSLGLASGIVAVAVWKTVFTIHHRPPRTDYGKFYGQLIPAHIIFAIVAGVTFQIMKKLTRRRK